MPVKKFAPAIIAFSALLLSACSSSSPDISARGQLNYACALAESVSEKLQDDPDWDPGPGPESDPMLDLMTSSATLLGAMTAGGPEVSEQMENAARDTLVGVSRLNTEVLTDSLQSIVEECDSSDTDFEASGDISDEGRITYACALITDVKKNDGPVDDKWELKIGPETPQPQIKAISAGVLMGVMTGGAPAASEEMTDAGSKLTEALSRADREMFQEGIDDLSAACAAD